MNCDGLFKILVLSIMFICIYKSFGNAEEIIREPLLQEEYLYQHSGEDWIDPRFFKWVAPINETWINPYIHSNPYWQNPLVNKISEIRAAKWLRDYNFHLIHAKKAYQKAHDKCWYLSDLSWRERGREAWDTAFTMFDTFNVLTVDSFDLSAVDSFDLTAVDSFDFFDLSAEIAIDIDLSINLIMTLRHFLLQYELDLLDEYMYIERKLKLSKFHLEQCGKYARKIDRG